MAGAARSAETLSDRPWQDLTFTHAQQGTREAVRLLHGMTVGFFAYALFCFTVSITIRGLRIAASFGLATALALAAQATAIALSRRREQLLSPEAAS